jgi:methyl-accepting chemotaxis protein
VESVSGLIKDRTVMTKILLAVLLVAVIGSGVAMFAVEKMAAVNDSTGVVYDGGLQLRTLGEMRNAFNRTRIDALEHFLATDSADLTAKEQAVEGDEQALAAAENAYKQFTLGPIRVAALAEFDQAWVAFLSALTDRLLPLSRAGKRSEVAAIREAEVEPLVAVMREAMDTLAAQTVVKAEETKAAAQDTYRAARTLIVTLIVLGVALGVAAAIEEMGTASIREIADLVRRVGDNAQHVEAARRDVLDRRGDVRAGRWPARRPRTCSRGRERRRWARRPGDRRQP